jgi:hypothetical protein
MSKLIVLVAFVIYVVCAAYAVFGPMPTRSLAASGWVSAAILLAVASADMWV